MSTDIQSGQLYNFRLKSQNAHGFSTEWSELGAIHANAKPDRADQVTTTVEGEVYVRIEWANPYDGSSGLTRFDVLIEEKGGAFTAEPVSCSGADPLVLFCDVPMLTLRGEPFNLLQGDIVVAIVRGVNANGEGAYSEPNVSGAVIQDSPGQMSSPVRGAATTESQIQLSWAELEFGLSTGGAVIDSYNLKWDSGDGTWVDLIGQDGQL